jgi:hypothetical protein
MIKLANDASSIAFNENDGSLESLKLNGFNLVRKAPHLFELGFRNSANDPVILTSGEFGFTFHNNGENLEFIFSGHSRYPDLMVRIDIKPKEDGFVLHPQVEGIPSELRLEWCNPISILLKDASGQLFQTQQEGWLPYDPMKTRYEIPDYPYYRHYPGLLPMQFIAYYYPEAGVYFGSHDYGHTTKAIECVPTAEGPQLEFRLFVGGECDAGKWNCNFDMTIGLFQGDWMEACDIYRNWVQNDPVLPTKGHLPKLVADSPVCVFYPVQGHGLDSGPMEPNEYFPYEKALPTLRRLASQLNSPLMVLLMHWEGTAPWAPPYVWPPLGGEKLLSEFADALHAEGHYLGLYCSGTAWTQTSSINSYSRVAQFEKEKLDRYMIRGPHGELKAWICNGEHSQRIGCDMCVSEEWPRETLKNELRKLAMAPIDYAQFFDQNLGGASHMCWAQNHSHPDLPGGWQTQSMTHLMTELESVIKETGSHLLMGCESAAADAYMRFLPFSDLRPFCWTAADGLSVPAYSYVFHEYINNFMGNQGGILQQLAAEKNPDNYLFRTAYAFCSGELLSVVLGAGGNITWGWGVDWSVPVPEQLPILELTRNLNAFRKQYGEYLQYGRMLRTPATLSGERWKLITLKRDYDMDAFVYSTWRSPAGKMALVICNFLKTPQTIRIQPNSGVTMFLGDKEYHQTFDITIDPLNVIKMDVIV